MKLRSGILLTVASLLLAGCSSDPTDVTASSSPPAPSSSADFCAALRQAATHEEDADGTIYVQDLDRLIAVSPEALRSTFAAAKTYELGFDMALINEYARLLEEDADAIRQQCQFDVLIGDGERLTVGVPPGDTTDS